MPKHVEGRVIVITGAGGGFGRLVATKTAALGAKVVASDVDEAALKETTEAIGAEGGAAIGVGEDEQPGVGDEQKRDVKANHPDDARDRAHHQLTEKSTRCSATNWASVRPMRRATPNGASVGLNG